MGRTQTQTTSSKYLKNKKSKNADTSRYALLNVHCHGFFLVKFLQASWTLFLKDVYWFLFLFPILVCRCTVLNIYSWIWYNIPSSKHLIYKSAAATSWTRCTKESGLRTLRRGEREQMYFSVKWDLNNFSVYSFREQSLYPFCMQFSMD